MGWVVFIDLYLSSYLCGGVAGMFFRSGELQIQSGKIPQVDQKCCWCYEEVMLVYFLHHSLLSDAQMVCFMLLSRRVPWVQMAHSEKQAQKALR